jgi:D-aminoacyl-tRNA deacylase
MRSVIQRVRWGRVRVGGNVVGAIDDGLLVLLGVGVGDQPQHAQSLAKKIAELRIFGDDQGRMNRSLLDTGGSALVVSQFTLYADTQKGRRPFFGAAAPPERARTLIEVFGEELARLGVRVRTGEFGAHMEVELLNDGPVTLILETGE